MAVFSLALTGSELQLGYWNPVHWGLPRGPDSATLLAEVIMNRCLAVFAIVVLFAVGAFAQTSVSATAVGANGIGTMHIGPPPQFAMRPITGAPYSGEQVNETVQTLVDGTHITRTMPATKVYRDSLGRTRTERQMFRGPVGLAPNVPDAPIIIEIIDPVAQSRYTLDTQNKVAHRQESAASRPDTFAATTVGGGGGGGSTSAIVTANGGSFTNGRVVVGTPNATGQMTDAARPQTTTEKLASQTIEGVLVEGTRDTTTWPVGAQGNDRPITMTNETWMSPELKVVILREMSDPRSGEQTQKLINISRNEPDPSLFQPPLDYTVVDEKADFTIKWGSPQQ